MEQPVVGHPVHLRLLLVVLVPDLGLHVAARQQEQVVHVINRLVGLLQTDRQKQGLSTRHHHTTPHTQLDYTTHCTAPHSTTPHCTALHYTTPHHTTIHHTTPRHTTPHHTTPHHTSPHLTSPHLTSPHLTTTPHYTTSLHSLETLAESSFSDFFKGRVHFLDIVHASRSFLISSGLKGQGHREKACNQ